MKTPVLLMVFNRPELTKRVFEAIRQAKPPKLFLVADGPRPGKIEDEQACQLVRAIIAHIDWPCEVFRDYAKLNLGCKRRVSTGIDWAFKNSEELIILEDDCLPSQSFFKFAEYCLEKFRHDPKIGIISGNNFVPSNLLPNDRSSFRFSRFPHIWGWASWRRVWENYSVELSDLPSTAQEFAARFECPIGSSAYFFPILQRVHRGEIDTWDYQLMYSLWKQGQLNISPNTNLVENIGFGPNATHTRCKPPEWLQSAKDTELPPTPPLDFSCNDQTDQWELQNLFPY